MFSPYYAFIGCRYAFVKRKNHFISFISLTSMLGIALGVLVLITVMSVMNGFSKEVRTQMLSVAPHITLQPYQEPLEGWQELVQTLNTYPNVVGAAPYTSGQGLLTANGRVEGVIARGILPEQINHVFPIRDKLVAGSLDSLTDRSYHVVLGEELARHMGLGMGDKVTFMIPEANISLAGVTPRLKRFTVSGIYTSGTQMDSRYIFLALGDANRLYRLDNGISGIQIRLTDELLSKQVAKSLNEKLQHAYWVRDWTQDYAPYFEAVKMEKTVMWCILFLIVAVAVFNLVSSLVMVVTDKRSDIAILRTMGATRQHIIKIFMIQGMLIGVIGTVIGLILGLLLAANVTDIVEFIQQLFKVKFISEDVYFIGFVPSFIKTWDVIWVCVISLLMSFTATLYPAWCAAGIQPAEALRYE